MSAVVVIGNRPARTAHQTILYSAMSPASIGKRDRHCGSRIPAKRLLANIKLVTRRLISAVEASSSQILFPHVFKYASNVITGRVICYVIHSTQQRQMQTQVQKLATHH